MNRVPSDRQSRDIAAILERAAERQAAQAPRLTLRELAAKAYEAKRGVTQRDRRDRSRRILWDRLESGRFGIYSRYDFDEVGFLDDDRAFIDIDGIRLAAPIESSVAGLYLIHDDGECQVEDIAHLGQSLAELEANP
ncbi:MAG: hypothetical protein K1X67_07855 [Fimbriimonadaceae bacterium]|nr:hypothetical protein [Fimbriimonadaceae bacterium]